MTKKVEMDTICGQFLGHTNTRGVLLNDRPEATCIFSASTWMWSETFNQLNLPEIWWGLLHSKVCHCVTFDIHVPQTYNGLGLPTEDIWNYIGRKSGYRRALEFPFKVTIGFRDIFVVSWPEIHISHRMATVQSRYRETWQGPLRLRERRLNDNLNYEYVNQAILILSIFFIYHFSCTFINSK